MSQRPQARRSEVIDTTAEADGVEVLERPADADDVDTRRRRFEMALGAPFAFTGDEVELLDAGDGIPGCFASLQCQCGECFKVDLLKDNMKPCPQCGVRYTHALVVGVETDVLLAQDFVNEVLEANGHEPMGGSDALEDGAGDDDDADDDDDDDGEQAGDDDAGGPDGE